MTSSSLRLSEHRAVVGNNLQSTMQQITIVHGAAGLEGYITAAIA
jgi:hypothetical protein